MRITPDNLDNMMGTQFERNLQFNLKGTRANQYGNHDNLRKLEGEHKPFRNNFRGNQDHLRQLNKN